MNVVKNKGDSCVYVASTALLDDDRCFARLYESVSDERKAKIDRYARACDKKLSLAAEILLKRALAEFDIREYELSYGRYGKPYIDGGPHFSLSHSHEQVMCAVSREEIGCDVEKIRGIDHIGIAKRFFAQSEYDDILKCDTELLQREMFFRLWTLKESYVKAIGLGTTMGLGSFAISAGVDRVTLAETDDKWHFTEYDLHDGYRYAVCSRTEGKIDLQVVSLSDCRRNT